MSGSVMRRLRGTAHGDRGSTLVAVIGVASVLALFGVILVSSVVFAIGQSTASRASVSAKSAAEAAIEAAASGVTGGVCWSGGAGTSSSPHWKAQVQKLVSAGADPALESSWQDGCPVVPAPPASTTFRVIATGWTQQKGSGNVTGDVRTMVAQFTVKQRPTSPEFNEAVFGDLSVSSNTALNLDGPNADVLTNAFSCASSGVIDGGVSIKSVGDVTLKSSPCTINGNVITEGSVTCDSSSNFMKDVTAGGDVLLNSGCRVHGNLFVNGNFSCPANGVVDGNLTVVGNVTKFSSGCTVGGNIYVGGSFPQSNPYTAPGNFWVKGNLTSSWATLTAAGSIRIGGTYSGPPVSYLHASSVTIGDTSLAAPAPVSMATYFPPSDPSLVFPKVTASDARWSGWTARKWTSDLKGLVTGGPAWPSGVCNENWVSGSSNFSGNLVVTTPTIYDLTVPLDQGGCNATSVGFGGGLTIQLNADAVIFVSGASFVTPFRVISGDSAKHSLYIVEPWPSSKASCATSGPSSIHGINLGSATANVITQDSNAAIMIYTPGTVTNNDPVTMRGQLYGCSVNLSGNSVHVAYQAANAGGGAGGGRAFSVTERFRMDDQSLQLPS